MNPFLHDVVTHLQSTGFRDLAGARLVLDVPLTDEWLNDLLAAWMASAPRPLKEARVRSTGQNHADVHLRLTKLSFVPLNVHLFIDRQPEFPASPVLVVRWETMSPGLTALASRALNVATSLPPGITMASDWIAIDLFTLLQRGGLESLLPMMHRVEVTTEPGRVLLHLTLVVPPSPVS